MQPTSCVVQKVRDDMSNSTGSQASTGEAGPPRRRSELPPEVLGIIGSALHVGGLCGVTGGFVGGIAGIARSTTPVLFALASGIQWFTLSSIFSASRGFVIHAWGKEETTSSEKISASAIAGGFAGTAGGLLRGRKNVLPGILMFTLAGAAGQFTYNLATARDADRPQVSTEKTSWLGSKWSPVTVMSDAEYENVLQERLLRINAEISLVDEGIEALRIQQQDIAAKTAANEKKI